MTTRTTTHRWMCGTALTGALVTAAVISAPAASAATQHDVPHLSTHQQHAAAAAAASPGARDLLATATRGAAARGHAMTAGSTTHVATHGTPVYALSAAFVRDDSDTVGQLWYVATPAATQAGPMTVFTAKDASGTWRAVNVASGNTEARMARAAGDASLLVEPQVDAWYAVSDNRIRPLNAAARQVVGKAPVSISAYQRIVHARYADKQANSAYAKRGTAGGFSASATTPGEATHSGRAGAPLGLAAGGALAAGAVGLRLKRRRHT